VLSASIFSSVFVHGFKVEDFRLVGAREAGSILGSYCEVRGGFFSIWFYFLFFGRAKERGSGDYIYWDYIALRYFSLLRRSAK
jgi:hypothetical protein